jgi:hypothetical protein
MKRYPGSTKIPKMSDKQIHVVYMRKLNAGELK